MASEMMWGKTNF